MSRTPKPVAVIELEKKSHRTKAEIFQRKQAEASISSSSKLTERPEVKKNEIAHKEFLRVKKILTKIGKNDAIYSAIINRYCLLYDECFGLENMQNIIKEDIEKLEEKRVEMEIDYTDYYKLKIKLQDNLIGLDKQIQAKRKMLFDIEKENVMTVAAGLRSIPKKPVSRTDKLRGALGGA